MKWKYDSAVEYRCSECGATGDPSSSYWRWNGDEWEHDHGYEQSHKTGTQWFRGIRKNPLKDNHSALDLLRRLREKCNNYAPPELLREVDAFIKQNENNNTGFIIESPIASTKTTDGPISRRDCSTTAAHGIVNAG